MKNSIYFIILALLVAELFKILDYANKMTCDVLVQSIRTKIQQLISSYISICHWHNRALQHVNFAFLFKADHVILSGEFHLCLLHNLCVHVQVQWESRHVVCIRKTKRTRWRDLFPDHRSINKALHLHSPYGHGSVPRLNWNIRILKNKKLGK